MKGPSDRVVRKAMLRAQAQIDRYEVARAVESLQAAASPRTLVQQALPGLLAPEGGPGQLWQRAGYELAGWYRQYPLVGSALTWALGRGGASRVVQAAGVLLAISKAFGVLRRSRRTSH